LNKLLPLTSAGLMALTLLTGAIQVAPQAAPA